MKDALPHIIIWLCCGFIVFSAYGYEERDDETIHKCKVRRGGEICDKACGVKKWRETRHHKCIRDCLPRVFQLDWDTNILCTLRDHAVEMNVRAPRDHETSDE